MVLSYERKLRRHKEYKKQICDGKGRIMEKHKHERSTFSGKIGFVLSAAGASVGLGNIWRFPYLAAKYGGGIFLLIYIILALTFGYSMIVAETALGRMTKKSPVGAFGTFGKSKWLSLGGWINAIIPVLIVPYYSVIGGWVIKYLVEYVKGGSQTLAEDGYFSAFIADGFSTETCFLFFTLLTLVIIYAGVQNGVERVSKLMMPILVFLSVVIVIYSVTRPGALEGVKYFLIPNIKNFSWMTVVAAMGQMFYSLSLSMGVMVTFGSYLNKKANIEKSVKMIEFFDVSVAILAGFMVIPAVFVFSGGNQDALNAGPGLMFVTLPKVFHTMGLSRVIGSVFFLLVFFAALTSAISITEAAVSTFCDRFHTSRRKAITIVAVLTLLLGIPSSLGYGVWDSVKLLGMTILDFVDFLTNAVMMPLGALLTSIFVGWIIGVKPISQEIKISSEFRQQKMFEMIIRYIAPVVIVLILISSVLNAFGIITL